MITKRFISASVLLAIISLVGFPGISSIVYAIEAQSTFQIGQVVTSIPDTETPSTPTNLSATAASSSEINLSWTASTDNVAVTGYRIYRDSVNVATTTSTSYTDTGLSSSTLYSYTITAIDAAYNESLHSNSASATTLTPAIVSPSGSVYGGILRNLILEHLLVIPSSNSAVIQFKTNISAQATVQWGRSVDYELGSIVSGDYLRDYSINIENLLPNTDYYFKILLVDGFGRVWTIENQRFQTLSAPETSPENVSNFRALPSEKQITLTWNNPKTDFDLVRIVRSDKFYPRDPGEGEIIYEGRGEKYIDNDVVYGKTYYYTAFSKDEFGNYSSGAVTDARLIKAGEKPDLPKLFAGVLQLPKELLHPLLQSFSLIDIDFIQDGKKLLIMGNKVEIRGDLDLTISIDYEKLPEILKTIAVTMYDPEDKTKTFSFLLRINKDKTAYQAHVGAFERPGEYEFALAILDHKHQGLGTFSGFLMASLPNLFTGEDGGLSSIFGNNPADLLWLLLLLIILLVMMSLIFRRKNKPVPVTSQDSELVNSRSQSFVSSVVNSNKTNI